MQVQGRVWSCSVCKVTSHYIWRHLFLWWHGFLFEEWPPAQYVKFQCGNFMCLKSRAILRDDQLCKQLIDWLKNHAGVIESLHNPSTVHHELVVRLEQARLVREFEGTDIQMIGAPWTIPKVTIWLQIWCHSIISYVLKARKPCLGEVLDLDQSLFCPKMWYTIWEKWKTSDFSSIQQFSTRKSALRKWLSLLQCTKLILSCSRLLCEPRRLSPKPS